MTETDGSFHLAIVLRHVLPLKGSPVAEMDFQKAIHGVIGKGTVVFRTEHSISRCQV